MSGGGKRRRRLWRAVPRPLAGTRLPRELRPRRVPRLAEALPQGVRDPGVALLLQRIDRSPFHSARQVDIYTRGADAFAAMAGAALQAEREVLLESYIFKDDRLGRAAAEILRSAAERGVAVKVLADAVGSWGTDAAFWTHLGEHGIEVQLFHTLLRHPLNQGFRDHRKILVVDRRVAFTGGMNIGDEYAVGTGETPAWRDTHARVLGTPAWEMAVVFNEGWVRAGGKPLDLPPLEPSPPPGILTQVLDSRPGRGHVESAAVLGAIAGAARRRLWITNSYFAPRRAVVGLLATAVRRGVDVRLLLPGRTDVPLVRHAGHGLYARLLAAGVRLWEYQPSVLHAKTLMADDYVAVVGSSNLDFRSFRFNAECNLLVLGEEPAAALTTAFEEDLAASVEIRSGEWSRRGGGHRLGDGLALCLAPWL
jgi:cardiolipin synthase